MQDGLLNQAVHHVWNAEVSLTAIEFGNRLAPGIARLVSSFQELSSNVWPLFTECFGETSSVTPSAPGAPRLALTFLQARSMLAWLTMLSIREDEVEFKAGLFVAAASDE